MLSRKHIVITGTGRCGTTFLVELLTYIGLETGFSAEDIVSKKHKEARAGLEHDIRSKDCPFIVKSPWFCDYAKEVIAREDIVIEHIFIPIRDLNAAAESRRHVENAAVSNLSFLEKLKYMIKPKALAGGLWHTSSTKPGKQEEILMRQIYKLMLAISETSLPVTFMRYPRIVKDCPYLFEKLKPILGGINYKSFFEVFSKTVRPKLIHSFNENDY
jgi:hypothetical protein